MQSVSLLYKNLLLFLLGLVALSTNATDRPDNFSEKMEIADEQTPSEEFWLFMAEFEDEEWIDPEELDRLDKKHVQAKPGTSVSEKPL